MKRVLYLAAMLLLSANDGVAQFVRATNVVGPYGCYTVKVECLEGILEKARLCPWVSTNDYPDAPSLWGHFDDLVEYKEFIRDDLLPHFVDHTLTNSLGQYYTSNNATEFQMWDATSVCAAAGVHTSFLDKSSPYDWFSTNNWKHVAAIVNMLRWTQDEVYPPTRDWVYPAIYSATNVVQPGRQFYWVQSRTASFPYLAVISGYDPLSCSTAYENQRVAWTNQTIVSNSAPAGLVDLISPPFYAVVAGVWTNVPSLYSTNHWYAYRANTFTWLDGIATNVSHKLELYGRVDGPLASWTYNIPWDEPGAATNFFEAIDTTIHGETEYRLLSSVNNGSIATTNYRAMDDGYLQSLLIPVRDTQNPAVKSALVCQAADYEIIQGQRVPFNTARFLIRYDANAATGLKWIF